MINPNGSSQKEPKSYDDKNLKLLREDSSGGRISNSHSLPNLRDQLTEDEDAPPPLPPSPDDSPANSPHSSPLPSPPSSPRDKKSVDNNRQKQKLRQLLGQEYESLKDFENLEVKRKEKLLKFFGGNPLQPAEEEKTEKEKSPRGKETSPDEKNTRGKSSVKMIPDDNRKLNPFRYLKENKDSPSSGSPSSPPEELIEPQPTFRIQIGDFKPPPGSEIERTLLEFLEGKIEETGAKQKYGVAFGVRRGACSQSCECTQYKSQDGGPCIECGHFPARHQNLGRAEENIEPDMAGLKWEIEMIKRNRSPSTATVGINPTPEARPITPNQPIKIRHTLDSSNPLHKNVFQRFENRRNTFWESSPGASPPIQFASSSGESTPNLNSTPVAMSPIDSCFTNEEQEIINKQMKEREAILPASIKDSSWLIDGKELEFIEKLGVGSSAKVYKGKYRNQEVAIKVLLSLPESKQREDFQREFEIMSSLRSPYVVYFYGAVIEPRVCMVMEFCSRGSLYDILKDENTQFDWTKVLKIMTEAVKGVSCLHSWKPQIVHRDLKTLNLLIDENWTCKVGDFGLSRFLSESHQSTLGKLRGTYAYCAPEVYFGQSFTSSSDIFSMGIIFWEMVTRCIKGIYERPYSEYPYISFDFQIILQTAKNNLRPSLPPNCPTGVAELIKSCWDGDPTKRPDCASFLQQLGDLQKQYDKDPKKWNDIRKKK